MFLCYKVFGLSQEVLGNTFTIRSFAFCWSSLKYLEELLQVLVKLHYRSQVTTSIGVVRGRPDCHQFFVEHVLVALHGQLMGSCYQTKTIVMQEGLNCVSTEEIASSSSRY